MDTASGRPWTTDAHQWAVAQLQRAYETGEPVLPLTDEYPGLTPAQAYLVQLALVDGWTGDGERVVGKKIGLTSLAAQQRFGVFEPDFGHLTDAMARPEDSIISLAELIQPRIEGEIAFVLRRDLEGRVTPHEVLGAIEYAVPVLEICDSRVKDWKLRAADLVADNTCSAMYVIGAQKRLVENLDLSRLGMVLERQGEVVDTGSSVAVMGHPVNAIVHLVHKLSRVGSSLKAGELVLSGAIGTMIPVRADDRYTLRIEGLGTVRVGFDGRGR